MEKINLKLKVFRRLTFIDNSLIPNKDNILVVDNSCDQNIININSFLVQSLASINYNISGDLNNMN